MKKVLLIGVAVALVLILVGGAGAVYAQARDLNSRVAVNLNSNQTGDQVVPFGYGQGGMMNGYGPRGMMGGDGYRGMMGGRGFRSGNGEGLMHDYIVSAFASAVNLSVDEVNTRLSNGETLLQIANAQGFTGDKLTQLATQVRQDAINQAVAAGVITQAQADLMLQRLQNNNSFGFGRGFGAGNCPMWDGDETQP